MSEEAQGAYAGIEAKFRVIAQRQQMLVEAVQAAREERDGALRRCERLQREIDTLKQEQAYATMAGGFAATPDGIAKARTLISGLIRDIDRCISEVKAT